MVWVGDGGLWELVRELCPVGVTYIASIKRPFRFFVCGVERLGAPQAVAQSRPDSQPTAGTARNEQRSVPLAMVPNHLIVSPATKVRVPVVRCPRPAGLAHRWTVDVTWERSANSLPRPTSPPIPPSSCHVHPPSPATASPGTRMTRAHPSPGSRLPAAMPPVRPLRAPPLCRPRCRHPPSTWPPHTPLWSQTAPARHSHPTQTPRSCRAATRTDAGLPGSGQTCPTAHSGRGQRGRRWQPRHPPATSLPPGPWPLPGRRRRRRRP